MLGLDSSNGYDNCRSHRAYYGLLKEEVYDLRVSYNFIETGNCFRELACVCELGRVIKTRGSGWCYSCFSPGDVEKRGIYQLGSSYVINKLLQDEINARSLLIAYVALELVNGMGKALNFC